MYTTMFIKKKHLDMSFRFIWFIAVKSHDMHERIYLIPPSKYKQARV